MWLRTMLYAPGNSSRLLQKVFEAGADAVILDLEDAVPQAERSEARTMVAAALEAHRGEGRPIFVRTNPPRSAEIEVDLQAIVRPGLTGIKLPKTASAEDVRAVEVRLAALERDRGLAAGTIILVPTLESAAGVLGALEIARASSRVWCLSFGAEDYAADTGCETSPEGTETLYARSHIVACSTVARIAPPVDSVFAALDDVEGLTTSARSARRLGFQGKAIVHPKQIEPVHAVFTPTGEQVAAARRTIQVADEATARGVGAIAHDGRLVDEAMVRRAASLVDRKSVV